MRAIWPVGMMQAECLAYANPYSMAGYYGAEVESYLTPTGRRQMAALHMSGEDNGPHSGEVFCGFYLLPDYPSLVKHAAELRGVNNTMVAVEAYCSGWGLTAVMETGWRTQYCRIDRLWAEKPPGLEVLRMLG